MLILISGQPGNGKTLRALDLARVEFERNAEAVKQGKEKPRRFFSNIAGATTEENPEAFPWMEAIPAHNDWQQLPDGSFVIYDEAHADGATPGLERYGTLFPGTGKPGESSDSRIRAMATHRHRGFDLVLVTQWPSKIHHNVRQLVGKHLHMTRAMGLQRAGILTWTRVQPDPYDETQRDKAEEEIWAYQKDLYTRYKSSTLHTQTYKFKIPRKLWSALCVAVVLGAMIWIIYAKFSAPTKDGVATGPQAGGSAAPGAALLAPGSSSVVELSKLPGTGRYDALRASPAPRVIGYVDSPRGCRMWGDTGEQLDISTEDCRRMIDEGVPLAFMAASRESSPPAAKEASPEAGPSVMAAVGTDAPYGSMASYGAMGVGASPR